MNPLSVSSALRQMLRKYFPASVALVLAATMAVSPRPASAFRIETSTGVTSTAPVNPTTPPPARWVHWDLREFPSCQVPYSIDAAGCRDTLSGGGFAAIASAFQSWSGTLPTPITFTRRPNAATNLAAQDGTNLFAFDSTNANAIFGMPLSGTLAITYVWTQAATRRQLESDVIFNDRDWQWSTIQDDFLSDTTAVAAPFAINAGDTLRVRVNGGPIKTVVFTNANITPGAATPLQVFLAINAATRPDSLLGFNTASGGLRLVANRYDGQGSLEIVSGTGSLPGALSFQAGRVFTRRADIETICLHEIGHFLGIAHSSDLGSEPNAAYKNAVMYAYAPSLGTKRVLTPDDRAALDFLYTPDLGDAPESSLDHYQSLVHTGTASRLLNGIQLTQPGHGAGHLFNYFALDSLKFEWLGQGMDENLSECEARVSNNDLFDDGVTYASPMIRGVTNPVTVKIGFKNAARYDAANPARILYVNGYFDFDGDGTFTAADREIWWRGTPAGTIAASANWTGALFNFVSNTITLDFDEIPSLLAAGTGYSRFRVDLGEDEGRVNNWNGDLGPAIGMAQYGEVEDSPFTTIDGVTPVQVARFVAEPSADAVTLRWTRPQGGLDESANVYRSDGDDIAETRVATGIVPGPEGSQFTDATVVAGSRYTYRLGLFESGHEVRGPSVQVVVPSAEFALGGAEPNPIGHAGAVRFSLPRAGHARLALYSVSGRLERVLADRGFSAGEQTLSWDGLDDAGRPLASGVYFLRLDSSGRARVQRTVVVR